MRGPGCRGVGGIGVKGVTAASCGSGHLCHSGSPSNSPGLISFESLSEKLKKNTFNK